MNRPAENHPAPPRRGWSDRLPVGVAVCLVLVAYLAPIGMRPTRTSAAPVDYYGLLTEAFHSGQLHLNIATDPVLLTLENPYAGPQGAKRPHDMSYYRGRFYLYYGATPALILYLPWRCLTGTYLHESVGADLLLAGGFLLAALWLVRGWRRWFPDLPSVWPALLILTLGLSPPLFTEIRNGTFYIVPIAGAFFCLMVAFNAADQALAATTPGRQAAWLALASLGWGLAVGSRPIYVLGLVMLALPALWLWTKIGPGMRWRWTGLRLLAAAVIPAAVIGAAIMTYNYLRFDSPFDFGIRFSMASGDIREARLVGTEFIGKNLHFYLLKVVAFIRYFPFIMPGGRSFGVLPHLPIVALAVLYPVAWLIIRTERSRWILSGLVLGGGALANLGLLCLFFGGEERYLLDFVPPLFLLAAATGLSLLAACRRLSRRYPYWITGVLVCALAAYAVFSGTMLHLSRRPESAGRIGLERWLNLPAHLLEKWAGTAHGPLELTVTFPRGRTGVREPLVSTGYGQGGGDVVVVHYLDETHVQFSAFHVGRGGPVSEPIEIDYDAPHRLRLALGSLYPPAGHPLFNGWPPSQTARIRRSLKIELDDRTVLQGNFMVHPSTPSGIQVGRNSLAPDVSVQAFTGRILAQRRLGLDRAEAAGFESSTGPVRLTLRFPPRSGDEGLPLVATGTQGGGDLVFAQLLEDNRVRFGHDSFGAGAIVSAPTSIDLAQDQVLDIEMGSLYPAEAPAVPPSRRNRLRITLNGVTQLDTSRPFNPSSPEEVEFGFNTIRASTAIDYFPGAIRKAERIPPSTAEESLQTWGHLRLAVILPPLLSPEAEPLVVTGHTGRADLLFLRHEADGGIRFGLDHWGVGLVLSDPVPIDRSKTQLIEVLSGGLLPPAGDAAWAGHDPAQAERLRSHFEVRLNGRTVFTPGFVPYPNERGETAIGSNLIGASTCATHFSGRFVLVERMPW